MKSQNNTKAKPTMAVRWGALVAYAAMIGANVLATVGNLNSTTTGEVSDSYPNLFAPAGFTFSIWGVIYTLLLLYTLWQLHWLGGRKKDARLSSATVDKVSGYFLLSSLLNSGWIFAWQYHQILLSLVLIVGLLVVLKRIHGLLWREKFTSRERWFVRTPFSVYLGWITVATIANATTWLVDMQWNGWGLSDEVWAAIVLIAGALVCLKTLLRRHDWAYGLVFVWAYAGIWAKHVMSNGWDGRYPLVVLTSATLMSVLLILSVMQMLQTTRRAQLD